ncbi:alpha-glucanase [Colletotrichum musicola]|uniref:Alpha-glucanase n=1 Tax=Colletotrichum musicola TaxID=2175873 RepID=A0A8H6KIL1_9PEZI|nr:alpha-glucanase [Colletotrichum musicola]
MASPKILALLALSPLAAAQSRAVTRVTRNSDAPYYINAPDWASYFTSPAYSAAYPFDGPDVSQPYPGSMIDGWSVSVAVQNGIPLDKASQGQTTALNRGKHIAGVRVTLNPPGGLLKSEDGEWELHDSWRICYSQMELTVNSTFMNRLRNDDGSCGGWWDQQCLRGIQRAVAGAWSRTNVDYGGACPFSTVMNCPSWGQVGSDSITAEDDMVGWRVRDSGVGERKGVQVLGGGSSPGDEDDERNLELARGYVAPLIVAFGARDRNRTRDVEPQVRIRLMCTRNTTTTDEGDEGR